MTQFGGPTPRRRPRNPQDGPEPQADFKHMLVQFLPIILFFLLPVLGSLWSSSTAGPSFSLHNAQSPYTKQIKTSSHKIPFWVNPDEYNDLTRSQKHRLDQDVVQSTVNELAFKCQQEKNEQRQVVDDAQGWFSVDQDKIKKARNMKLKSCERLQELNNQGI